MTNAITSGLAFGLGTQELIIIAVILLLLFGGAKIPQLMRGLGKGMGEFKKGIEESKNTYNEAMAAVEDDEPKTSLKDDKKSTV